MYTYEINGKKFTQEKLRLGQLRQLLDILKDIVLPSDFDTISLVSVLGDKISEAIAIILIEEGKTLKDKNVIELANEIEFELDLDKTLEIVNDFFDCNDLTSLFNKFTETINKVTEKMSQEK